MSDSLQLIVVSGILLACAAYVARRYLANRAGNCASGPTCSGCAEHTPTNTPTSPGYKATPLTQLGPPRS